MHQKLINLPVALPPDIVISTIVSCVRMAPEGLVVIIMGTVTFTSAVASLPVAG